MSCVAREGCRGCCHRCACARGGGAGHAAERAALLRHLLDAGAPLDLGSLNGRLETPVHCALRSGSAELLEVRLW